MASETAFSTYTELMKAIEEELARGDLSPAIPRWIRLVEAELQRDLDIRETETTATGTLLAEATFPFPDDCLWPRWFQMDTDPIRRVTIVSRETLANVQQQEKGNFPIAATVENNGYRWYPIPAAGTAYTFNYVSGFATLSQDRETNVVLSRAPDVYFYGALLHSAPYLQQPARIGEWRSFYEPAKESFKRMEWRARTGGGPLAIRPDQVPNDSHNRREA